MEISEQGIPLDRCLVTSSSRPATAPPPPPPAAPSPAYISPFLLYYFLAILCLGLCYWTGLGLAGLWAGPKWSCIVFIHAIPHADQAIEALDSPLHTATNGVRLKFLWNGGEPGSGGLRRLPAGRMTRSPADTNSSAASSSASAGV
jgi:hypothetical protein